MRKRLLIVLGVVAVGLITYAVLAVISSSVRLEFDFRDGAQGWQAGFAEYAPEMEDMQLEAGIRPLPSELGINGTGYYIQGMNHSDDLFMFLKRRLGSEDGVVLGQKYRVKFTIVFASNAPSGAYGIGGSPGESVFLKAGASTVEPEVYLDPDANYYLMNVDKGLGNDEAGGVASVVGDIANGLSAEEVDLQNPPYVSLKRQHEHTVTANPDGGLWLLVGTDSGFEGLTGIYYQRIAVTLTPVK
ncbi:MAG: PEP-CTERM sorting domain-containing protein [Chloroflexi bacterium]|nr:PEP-CTERM sorting domain-containing protein [Chloroflexota bacterium]